MIARHTAEHTESALPLLSAKVNRQFPTGWLVSRARSRSSHTPSASDDIFSTRQPR